MHISYSRHISFFLSLARKGSSVKSIDATSDLVKVHLSFSYCGRFSKEGWYTEEIKRRKTKYYGKKVNEYSDSSRKKSFFSPTKYSKHSYCKYILRRLSFVSQITSSRRHMRLNRSSDSPHLLLLLSGKLSERRVRQSIGL